MADEVDSLYVGLHVDDILLSCAGRIASDQARGQRSVLVGLFDPPADPASHARDLAVDALLPGLGPRRVRVGLAPAPERHAGYRTWASRHAGWEPVDEECMAEAAEKLRDQGFRTRAKNVLVPLGVGGLVDQRVAHQAAVSAYRSGDGRNVFLYEERPEALVPGAVRMRLAQLGARLPPGAAQAAEAALLPSFLLSFHVPPSLRGDLRGLVDRLRNTGLATRQWRAARSWQPLKGLGPRLQPLVEVAEPADAEVAERVVACVMPGSERSAPRARVRSLARNYGRRLADGPHAERYWLLLPDRAGEGQAAPSGLEAALPA